MYRLYMAWDEIEMAENRISTLASASIFFDDCCGRYYSAITGVSYHSREDAEEDVVEKVKAAYWSNKDYNK